MSFYSRSSYSMSVNFRTHRAHTWLPALYAHTGKWRVTKSRTRAGQFSEPAHGRLKSRRISFKCRLNHTKLDRQHWKWLSGILVKPTYPFPWLSVSWFFCTVRLLDLTLKKSFLKNCGLRRYTDLAWRYEYSCIHIVVLIQLHVYR